MRSNTKEGCPAQACLCGSMRVDAKKGTGPHMHPTLPAWQSSTAGHVRTKPRAPQPQAQLHAVSIIAPKGPLTFPNCLT